MVHYLSSAHTPDWTPNAPSVTAQRRQNGRGAPVSTVCGNLCQVHERGAQVGPDLWGRQLQAKALNGTGVLCVDSRQCVVWAFLRGKWDTSVLRGTYSSYVGSGTRLSAACMECASALRFGFAKKFALHNSYPLLLLFLPY